MRERFGSFGSNFSGPINYAGLVNHPPSISIDAAPGACILATTALLHFDYQYGVLAMTGPATSAER